MLTTLVGAYEAKHCAGRPSDAIEIITFRMDQLGMTREDLEAILGGRGRVSEILTKKRGRAGFPVVAKGVALCVNDDHIAAPCSTLPRPAFSPLPFTSSCFAVRSAQ
jgi:hypothetical protein